jgi:hypothetical protein
MRISGKKTQKKFLEVELWREKKKRLPDPPCPDNKSLYTFNGDIQNCPRGKKFLEKTKVGAAC